MQQYLFFCRRRLRFQKEKLMKLFRVRVFLKSPGEEHTFAYTLHFPCSNNEAEYEALLVGLKAA